MAFVDLWRGILFCDVLGVDEGEAPMAPLLRYVTVPEPMEKNKALEGDARLYRDMAVVGDHLTSTSSTSSCSSTTSRLTRSSAGVAISRMVGWLLRGVGRPRVVPPRMAIGGARTRGSWTPGM
ncbi:unnamed protein product [Urochloa humidicola]